MKMAKIVMKSFEAQKWQSANVSIKINGSENNENNHQWRERKRKMKVISENNGNSVMAKIMAMAARRSAVAKIIEEKRNLLEKWRIESVSIEIQLIM
jgi:hypothetical protein